MRLWDISTASASAMGQRRAGTELLTCYGHTGSVKSVCARPNDRFVFASGSRDGAVHIYDTRQGGKPAMRLCGVHAPSCTAPKRKRAGPLGGTGSHGVTSVLYLMDERNALATAGGTDGAVKLWDSRLGGAVRGRAASRAPGGIAGPTAPLCTLLPDRGSERHHGITSLAIDGSGGRLLASSTDNAIYCYDTVRPERGELARFSGHQVHRHAVFPLGALNIGRHAICPPLTHPCVIPPPPQGITVYSQVAAYDLDGTLVCWLCPSYSAFPLTTPGGSPFSPRMPSPHPALLPQVGTFYVKARFSHDGRFILSGSSDGHVYIWEVDRPAIPPLYLEGHAAEVTGVDWHPVDLCQVASCSDDGTVRVWRVDRGTDRRARGGAALLPSPSLPADAPAGPSVVHSPWPVRTSSATAASRKIIATPSSRSAAAQSLLGNALGIPGPAVAATPQVAPTYPPAGGWDASTGVSMDVSDGGVDASMDTSGEGTAGGRPSGSSSGDRPTLPGRASPAPGTNQASLRDYFGPALVL